MSSQPTATNTLAQGQPAASPNTNRVVAAVALPTPVPQMPGTFDPEAATDADLLYYGLPQRPCDPTMLGLWRQLVGRPFDQVAVTMAEQTFTLSWPRLGLARGDESDTFNLAGSSRLSSSANWSGAVILPLEGRQFVQVLGRWKVPRVRRGAGASPHVCSIWVGLDGFKRQGEPSMPQMGTTQKDGNIGSGVPDYYLWVQWWLRGGKTIESPKLLAELRPDDEVTCGVTLLPPDIPSAGDRGWVGFAARIKRSTWPRDRLIVYRMPPPQNASGAFVPTRGRSAQWIFERPREIVVQPDGSLGLGGLYRLPRFMEARSIAFAAIEAPGPPVNCGV
ncbi:MAG TPA: G1 family glutamic endopeptidase, partial [Rariglobus sp.]